MAGPRDDVRAGGRGETRDVGRQRRHRSRRHRSRPVRHGHLWIALARGRRHGHRQGPRQGDRQGKKIAAHLLEAAETDIEFNDGKFTVAGTDKSKTFGEIALTAYVRTTTRSTSWSRAWNEMAFYDPTNFTFPAGTHICEVEIDPETGVVQVVAFAACDDFGNIVNPMIVEGQVHGGLTQGIGQALLESCVYDQEADSS